MNFKKLVTTAAMFGAVALGATSAHAQSAYVAPLNTALGTGAALSCSACHTGTTNTSATATLPMALTYAAGLNLATTDSDLDGFTNLQEANGAALNFNVSTITPFTIEAAISALANTDTVLAKFVVQGDSTATSQAFSDPYALATAGVTEVLGAESLTINSAPVDVYYKGAGIDATVTLYSVDVYGQGTVSPMGPGWTANADGSLHVVALPAGATSVTGVVVRTIPVITNIIGDNGSSDDGDGDSSGGCIGGISTTPLMMLLAMLSLGFFVRRKQD